MANAMVTIIFQISDATPVIRLLIRVVSDLKVTFNYLSYLDEMFYTKQLKDGICNGDNHFFKISKVTPIIRLSIRVLNAFDFELSSFSCILFVKSCF